MGSLITTNQQEKIALQGQTGLTSNFSLHDVRTAFYGGKVSQNDAIRAYLQSQLGITKPQSLSDLWRQFFILKGAANQMSLGDMARYFFTNIGFGVTSSPLLTGLIAYYKYDENTGTVVGDATGNGHGGTYNGTGTAWTPGKINSGGHFTRANTNYVLSTINANLGGSFTFNCWFKATATIIGQSVFGALFWSHVASYDNHWAKIEIDGINSKLQCSLYDGSNNPSILGSNGELTANTFYMATFVRNTGTGKIQLYLNGASDATDVTDTTASAPTYSDFIMGARHAGGAYGDPYDGIIDEAGVWSRALSTSDIALLYNSGAGRQYSF